jgi:hypothetical protein
VYTLVLKMISMLPQIYVVVCQIRVFLTKNLIRHTHFGVVFRNFFHVILFLKWFSWRFVVHVSYVFSQCFLLCLLSIPFLVMARGEGGQVMARRKAAPNIAGQVGKPKVFRKRCKVSFSFLFYPSRHTFFIRLISEGYFITSRFPTVVATRLTRHTYQVILLDCCYFSIS